MDLRIKPVLFARKKEGDVIGAVLAHINELIVKGIHYLLINLSKWSEKLWKTVSRCQNQVDWTHISHSSLTAMIAAKSIQARTTTADQRHSSTTGH